VLRTQGLALLGLDDTAHSAGLGCPGGGRSGAATSNKPAARGICGGLSVFYEIQPEEETG
jgi:hypothetical protein